jgi:hypothetical protein
LPCAVAVEQSELLFYTYFTIVMAFDSTLPYQAVAAAAAAAAAAASAA